VATTGLRPILRPVLTWAKLDAGRMTYYQNSVAASRESYYSGHGEAAGYYLGEGSRLLGLGGEVTADRFAQLAEGNLPGGAALAFKHKDRVQGFDLTMSAPKSVSLLFAAGGEQAAVLRDCHDRAVAATIATLEREAAFVKRGKGGHEVVRADGLVVAGYRHRTSRAGDPNLHTHAIVFNAARGPDGRWTAIHHIRLRDFKKAAGAIYRAELRANVREDLGLRWGPLDRKGLSELEGFDKQTLRAFSKRRVEIEREARGSTDSAAAMAGVALSTRRAKRDVDWPAVQQTVREALGRELSNVVAAAVAPTVLDVDHGRLASPAGLTQMRNTFKRTDVIEEVAQSAPQGARAPDILGDVDRFIGREDVLTVNQGAAFTVNDLVAAERARRDAQLGRAGEGACVISERTLRRGTAALSLNDGQRRVIEQIFTAGRGVDVIESLAGSGKTHTAGAVRSVAQEDGRRVIGTGPTARAVRELQAAAGINDAYTLDALLLKLDHDAITLSRRDVIVADEMGMAGTRPAARLEEHARAAGAKLVQFRDSGQLQSVLAGGELQGVHEQLGGLRLDQVMRQRDPEEIRALGALHAGHSDYYATWAEEHDRIVYGASVEQAVSAYQQAVGDVGYQQAALIAPTNALAGHCNELVRERRREAGELGTEKTVGGLDVAIGDRVICRRNDPMLDVVNSDRATVIGFSGSGVDVRLDRGGYQRHIPQSYIEDGDLHHGYAATGHATQGANVEKAVVIGHADEMYREWAYPAFSRARDTTRIYVVDQAARGQERAEIGPMEQERVRDQRAELVRTMATSRAEELAVEQLDRGRELEHGLEL
jgi:conjugative relaxase-like TrwC/TraI family protein